MPATTAHMIASLRTGDLIRHERIALGMTQSELAAYLTERSELFRGVDTVTISRWEAGRVYPSTRRLIAFSKILYPQHTRTTLRQMINDRPRGAHECPISKINAFPHHPYLVGEAHRGLSVSHDLSRLTSGARRCIDPFFTPLKTSLNKGQESAQELGILIVDPNTQEIFGHLMALASPNPDLQRGLFVTSIYGGSDRIFEFLMSQFFRFAVQQDPQPIHVIASSQQQRSLAKRIGMVQSRSEPAAALKTALADREAQTYTADYFEVLAHPDFVGLFASDIAPYPTLEIEAAQGIAASDNLDRLG